jgi:hypothetical protein
MKHISINQFIATLQQCQAIMFGRSHLIDPYMFVHELHHEPQGTAVLLQETGKRLRIPISNYRVQDFLRQGMRYNVQDLYHEFLHTADERKYRRFRFSWTWVAYGLTAFGVYELFHAQAMLCILIGLTASAILEYLKK